MNAYKFLATGAVARFSRYRWTPDMHRPEPLVPCRSGFHACRVRDLPYWIDDELWIVGLAGRVEELDFSVVAEEAWLVERIEAWPDPMARQFAAACVERVRRRAAGELGLAGEAGAGERLPPSPATVAELKAVSQAAGSIAEELFDRIPARAVHLLQYTRDAADYAAPSPGKPSGVPAAVAYIAAFAAGRATPSPEEHYGPGVTLAQAERSWQANWLAGALGLQASLA